MNIQLISDLHLETHPHFTVAPAPDADLLVLAGDIGSYQEGSLLAERGIADFGLARFSPLPAAQGGAGWPVPVFYIPGNHEYDGLDFDATHERLREACARLGITWMERESMVWGGVRFIACVLWTDFDALALQQAKDGETLAVQLKERQKAFRAANFYLKRFHTLRGGEPMLAEAMREESLKSQVWLKEALALPFDGKTVVITHFAPSLLSADPRYGLVPGTAGFCNSLDELLPLADVWMHGHLHCAIDYVSQGCRVVANPLGYAGKGEQDAFSPGFCVTV